MQGGKCTKCPAAAKKGIGAGLIVTYSVCGLIFNLAVLAYIAFGSMGTSTATDVKDTVDDIKEKADALKDDFEKAGLSIRLKIFMGYAQVISYFSVTFDSIPWPQALLDMWRWLELTSIDFYALFGELSCAMQTGFLDKFMLHMLAVPVLAVAIALACVLAKMLCRKKSIEAKAFSVINFVSFTCTQASRHASFVSLNAVKFRTHGT